MVLKVKEIDPRASVMRCEDPVVLGERTVKGSGRVLPVSRQRCGRCLSCVSFEVRQFRRRCVHEYESMPTGTVAVMGTLTFAPAWYASALVDGGHACWRLFKADIRKAYRERFGDWRVKLLGVVERGEQFGRLHVHYVGFGVPGSVAELQWRRDEGKNYLVSEWSQLARSCWPYARVEWASPVRGRGGVVYALKYVQKGLLQRARSRVVWRRAVARFQDGEGDDPGAFAHWFWFDKGGRGRGGGMGRQWAERVAGAMKGDPRLSSGEVLPLQRGPKVERVSRYERDVMRSMVGLDTEAAKVARQVVSPEVVEMACRLSEAGGSLDALRASGGACDPDVAEAARVRLEALARWGKL